MPKTKSVKKGETIIHINTHVIKNNDKTGERNPVITVKTNNSNDYAHEVLIKGEVRVIYSPDKPLKCGAVCWLQINDDTAIIIIR